MNYTNITGTPNLPDEHQPEQLANGLSISETAISSTVLSAVLLVMLACIRLVQVLSQKRRPEAERRENVPAHDNKTTIV